MVTADLFLGPTSFEQNAKRIKVAPTYIRLKLKLRNNFRAKQDKKITISTFTTNSCLHNSYWIFSLFLVFRKFYHISSNFLKDHNGNKAA